MTTDHVAAHHTLTNCPVCSGSDLRVLEPASDLQAFITTGDVFTFHMGLSACNSCGFIFVNPRATQDELTRYYGLQARKPRVFSQLDKPYADLLDFQAAFVRKRWNAEGAQRLLDVGSAEGFFLKRLADECAEPPVLEGVEPGSVYANAARELMPDAIIHEQVIEEAQLPAQSYDVVTLRHVLEHLVEPVLVLGILHDLLKPSGVLHIEVPDVTEIPANLSPFIHHEHMNSFTPETLRLAIERSGFEILVHESAQDNPVGSGFSYPIQRVLAKPLPAGFVPPAPPRVPDVDAIYNGYSERQKVFIEGQIAPTHERLLELASQGKRIGVFGAGPHTFDLFRTLKLSPSLFACALDNNSHKIGKHMLGLEIVQPTPESVAGLDVVLVSSAEFEGAMADQIASFDLPEVEVLRLYGH